MTSRTVPPAAAIAAAFEQAMRSPCSKSHRGVAVTRLGELVGQAFNHPPRDRACAGDDACRAACAKLCIHAEVAALRDARCRGPLEVVHLKVVDAVMVPSGGPSCSPCATAMFDDDRVEAVWLLHAEGWRRYPIVEFYKLTMQDQELPVLGTRPRRTDGVAHR